MRTVFFISALRSAPHLLSMLLFSLRYFLHWRNAESSSLEALMNNIKRFRRNKLRLEPDSFLQCVGSARTEIVS